MVLAINHWSYSLWINNGTFGLCAWGFQMITMYGIMPGLSQEGGGVIPSNHFWF